jgi:hypothetical protein
MGDLPYALTVFAAREIYSELDDAARAVAK